MNFVVCDVETSGFRTFHNDVVSCALVILDRNLNVTDTFYGECSPWDLKTFDEETVKVHGLTLAYLSGCQSTHSMCLQILHFLNPYRDKEQGRSLPFVYHALRKFDYFFLVNAFYKTGMEFSWNKVFNEQNTYSTVEMARAAGFQDNNLSTWAERLNFKLDHHDAMSDALACGEVFKYLKQRESKDHEFALR